MVGKTKAGLRRSDHLEGIDGKDYRVRYIGIDTPETVHPTRGEEPYGREASARNKELIIGATVYLEKDVSETDRYGRLLRYVWLADGSMVNATQLAPDLFISLFSNL